MSAKNMNELQIKNLIKKIIEEDEELTLNKELAKKVKYNNAQILKVRNLTFKQLLNKTMIEVPFVLELDNDYELIKSNLEEHYQEVNDFIQKKKAYSNFDTHYFDVGSYFLYGDHKEKFEEMLNLCEEFQNNMRTLIEN